MDYTQVMSRHLGVLTEEDQEKIRNTTVAVAGLGGTGSTAAVLAAKAGFGCIIVADKDEYEAVNIVEQLLATAESVGQVKADVAVKALSGHGPFARIRGVVLNISTIEEAKSVLQGADYAIVAVDEPLARVLLSRAARELGIAILMPANIGWKVINAVYLPDGEDYERLTRQFSYGKELNDRVKQGLEWQQRLTIVCNGTFDPDYAEEYLRGHVPYISYFGAPAFFAASLAISDLIKLVTGKGEVMIAPKSFGFDLLKNETWDVAELGYRVGQVAPVFFQGGMEKGIAAWKRVMGIESAG